MLAAVEDSFWTDPQRNEDDGDTRYPRVEIFNRINAARLTKSEESMQIFMHELSGDIRRHCRQLREGAVAELPAQLQDTPSMVQRNESPISATSIETPLASGPATSSSDEDPSIPSQDEAERAQSNPNANPPSQSVSETPQAALPMHKYTSMLWEFAARSGQEPRFQEGGILGAWICQASFNGYHRQATAPNKKKARHLAAKALYQALDVPQGLADA